MALVLYEKKGRLAHITLNRPEKVNALSSALADELSTVWVDFRDDEDLWVAILSGAGKAFCAGADVRAIGDRKVAPLTRPAPLLSTSTALLASPKRHGIYKPIIAAVHGYALGAGLGLALACDLRIATEDAQFGYPEPRWNLPATSTALIPRIMARGVANELLLLADRIDAQRAYQVGLVNRIVPSREDLIPAATVMAERICENGPLAVRAMKEVLERTQDMDYYGALAFSEHVFAPVRASEDMQEGARAFREKRKPQWKAR